MNQLLPNFECIDNVAYLIWNLKVKMFICKFVNIITENQLNWLISKISVEESMEINQEHLVVYLGSDSWEIFTLLFVAKSGFCGIFSMNNTAYRYHSTWVNC